MKIRLPHFLVFFWLMAFCASPSTIYGQSKYKSEDKKAIKWYEEAVVAFNQRDDESAEVLLEQAVERDDQFYEAWEMLSHVYYETGREDLAKLALEQAVSIDADYQPKNLYYLGAFELNDGHYPEALTYFTSFLAFNPESNALMQLAKEGLATCDFALEALKTAVPFEPQNLGTAVNSRYPEYLPCLTADDALMLFTRRIEDPRAPDGFQDDLFYAVRGENDQWQNAQNLRGINTVYNEGAASISGDGSTLVFTACELFDSYGPGRTGYGSCDLFIAYRTEDGWSAPQNMGPAINSTNWESQPSISADGRTVYYIRAPKRRSQNVNQDIYFSKRNADNTWLESEKLPPTINTPKREETVLIHPDGHTLYFSSNGHVGMGGLDLFMSRKDSLGRWQRPINLGYPINTHKDENSLMVSTEGSLAYFSSNSEGGFGSFDIYGFELYPQARPLPVTYVSGQVTEKNTKTPVSASFELVDLSSGEVVYKAYTLPIDGSFLIPLTANRSYGLTIEKDGYLFHSQHFELDSDQLTPLKLNVELIPIAAGEEVVLNNVFFDLDQFILKPASKNELNRLIRFLDQNENLNIGIEGHTDNQGSVSHNKTLSTNRAKAVYDYLVNHGIEASRLNYQGFGAEKPVSDNETPEGRAKNRRTAFRVLKN